MTIMRSWKFTCTPFSVPKYQLCCFPKTWKTTSAKNLNEQHSNRVLFKMSLFRLPPLPSSSTNSRDNQQVECCTTCTGDWDSNQGIWFCHLDSWTTKVYFAYGCCAPLVCMCVYIYTYIHIYIIGMDTATAGQPQTGPKKVVSSEHLIWWFQPIGKRLVGVRMRNVWNHHLETGHLLEVSLSNASWYKPVNQSISSSLF